MEDKQKINIRFGSWDLPMTVLRKDEHIYRNAEALMKERSTRYLHFEILESEETVKTAFPLYH